MERFAEVGSIDVVVEIARQLRVSLPDARLAVATNSGRVVAERTLRQLGILEWFPVIVMAEDTARHKLEPDVFLEAARRLGVAPAACRSTRTRRSGWRRRGGQG